MQKAAPTQLVLLTGTFAVWALLGAGVLWTAVVAYLGLWVLLGRWPKPVPWIVPVALVVIGAWTLVHQGPTYEAFLEGEGLLGAGEHLRDRQRLENLPALAPSVVLGDRPQRFYLETNGAESASVRFGTGTMLEGVALGHGLFAVDYDPRRHGTRGLDHNTAMVRADDKWTERSLEYVSPLSHPRWFCRAPGGRLAATVSEETDSLHLVQDDGSVTTLPVGDGPSDCAFLAEDRIAVVHRHGPTIWLLSPAGQVLRRVPWPGEHRDGHSAPPRVAVTPNGERMALSHSGEVVFLRTHDFTVEARLALRDPDWIVFGDDETLVISTRRDALLHRATLRTDGWALGVPIRLSRPAVTAARGAPGTVVVSSTDYLAGESPHLGNHFVQDQLITVDTDAWRVVDQTITGRRSERQSSAGNTDRGVSPMGIALGPGGVQYVAFAGTDELWMDEGGPTPRWRSTEVLHAPHGVVVFDNGAVSVTSPSTGRIGTWLGDAWRIVQLGPTTEDESPRRRGERAFYESTRSGVSCQSCHLHSDTDFALRNIGGARLAPTLGVGGIAGTSPYLRDASYPRIRDLNHLAQGLLRGYLRRAHSRGTDVEAYVSSLPRRRAPPGDANTLRRGYDAFRRAQCTTCHAPPAFTHLGQHPSGVLFPDHGPDAAVLDTPSLLSVSTHGPYLSDGRAETLASVLLEHNASGRHGDAARLTDEERADLLAFLESL